GFETKGDLTASFSGLAGKLRGVAASGSGTLTRSGGIWGFKEVRLGLGSARLALDGHLSERLDLRFALSADDLSLLAPGTRGEIKASGTLGGTLAEPVIIASAHGGDFDYDGIQLESLDADLDFDPTALQRDSKIDARLRKLSFRGRTLESIAFSLSGPPGAYRAHLTVAATGLAARLDAHGAYAHRVFNGELDALAVNGSGSLRAELTDAEIAHRLASRKVERTRIGSGTVTLSATPAVVSLQAELGDGEVGTIHGRIDAERITAGAGSPVESLAHWPDMPLSGELHAQTAELGLLSLYVPDIDRASGHFNADVQLAGTAGSPRLAGAVRVSEG